MSQRWNGLVAAVALTLSVVAVQVFNAPLASGTTIPPGSVHVENVLSDLNTLPSKPAGGAHVVVTELRPVSDATGDGFVTAAVDELAEAPWLAAGLIATVEARPGQARRHPLTRIGSNRDVVGRSQGVLRAVCGRRAL
jgi:hypothetical protein